MTLQNESQCPETQGKGAKGEKGGVPGPRLSFILLPYVRKKRNGFRGIRSSHPRILGAFIAYPERVDVYLCRAELGGFSPRPLSGFFLFATFITPLKRVEEFTPDW